MKITTLIENTTKDSLLCEHGLSFYIAFEDNSYLLDSGSSALFLKNAEALKVDVQNVKCAILSHAHYDHSGGFSSYLEENKNVNVYCMKGVNTPCYSTSGGTLHYIGVNETLLEKHKTRFIEIEKPTYIAEHVLLLPHSLEIDTSKSNLYIKKENTLIHDDFKHELSLIFETKKGLVIFNSCSHVGILNIIKEVQNVYPNQKIYAFIGGLHMKAKKDNQEISIYSEHEIKELCMYLKKIGLKHLYTGHCTGNVAMSYFKKYAEEIVDVLYSGKIIQL